MLGDGVPLPVTAETPARILRTVEKENSYGGRRLSSATISKGGVTVRSGGTLEVLDGGSLEIVTGDLILAAGVITGEMLKEHIYPEIKEKPRTKISSLGNVGGSKWQQYPATITFTAPAWAEKAIILTVVNEGLAVSHEDYAQVFKSFVAPVIAGNRGTEHKWVASEPHGAHVIEFDYQVSHQRIVTIPANRQIPVGYAHQIAYPQHITLNYCWVQQSALALWIK